MSNPLADGVQVSLIMTPEGRAQVECTSGSQVICKRDFSLACFQERDAYELREKLAVIFGAVADHLISLSIENR